MIVYAHHTFKSFGPFWADIKEHEMATQPAFKDTLQISGHNTAVNEEMDFRNGVFLGDTGHHRKDKTALMRLTHMSDDGVTYVPHGIELQIMGEDGELKILQVLNFTKSESATKSMSVWSATSPTSRK